MPDGFSDSLVSGLGIGRVQRVLALRSFHPYDQLDPEELAAIAHRMRERRFAVDDRIAREGSALTHIHFVLRGEVELRRGGRRLRRLGDHSVVGGLGALSGDPKGYEIVVTAPTTTLELPVEESWDHFEEHFVLGMRLVQALAEEGLALRRRLPNGFGYAAPMADPRPLPEGPLDLVERVASIRHALTFVGSRLESLTDLAREVREVRVPAETALWKAGDPADDFLIVHQGVVRCEAEEGGFSLGPADVVGAMDCCARQPRWYDATSSSEVLALRVRRETLLDVFEDHFTLTRSAIRSMAGNIIDLLEKVEHGAR